MTATIDLDIGGTFTDCVVIRNKQLVYCKAKTTGYNLAVGFMNALREAAGLIGIPLQEPAERDQRYKILDNCGHEYFASAQRQQAGFYYYFRL